MAELGELENRHADFARRDIRVVAISLEGRPEAEKTQRDFPHLKIVADPERNLTGAAELLHPNSGPGQADTITPTTVLVDRHGIVKWVYRPDRVIRRLSPDELLDAADKHFGSPGR